MLLCLSYFLVWFHFQPATNLLSPEMRHTGDDDDGRLFEENPGSRLLEIDDRLLYFHRERKLSIYHPRLDQPHVNRILRDNAWRERESMTCWKVEEIYTEIYVGCLQT